MTTRTLRLALATLGGALLLDPADSGAQSLAQRVRSAGSGLVQFSYAAREGVCAGRHYISYGDNNYSGSFNGSVSETLERDPCQSGPVRVVIALADGEVVDVDTYVARQEGGAGARDLGTVGAQEAADYLLSLAATSDGKPGRESLLPAMLADSADIFQPLASLARDVARPRETRRSALSYLGRRIGTQGVRPERATAVLLDVARDANDQQEVRRQALSVLGRLEDGAGVPALMELARVSQDPWVQKEATSALARSGDPRALDYLRQVASRADVTEDTRVAAIRGLGREYATAADARFLRELYPKLEGEKSREAVISAVTEIGGSDNVRFLLDIARSDSADQGSRRRALSGARRAGASMSDLVAMYDRTSDVRLKESLIGIYAESGERQATDKLLAIARGEEDSRLRRRSISRLASLDDPRVKRALAEIVER